MKDILKGFFARRYTPFDCLGGALLLTNYPTMQGWLVVLLSFVVIFAGLICEAIVERF
jgi:hypothetical protein